MRTTVSIDDELLKAAKRRAAQRNQPLGHVVEDALRRELASETAEDAAPPVPIFRGGTGPRPGVDLTSNRALHEFLDETLELDQQR